MVGKSEGKGLLGSHTLKWEDDIKVVHTEVVQKRVNKLIWASIKADRDVGIKFRIITENAKDFPSNFLTSSFSKRNMVSFSLLVGYVVIYTLSRTNCNQIRCCNVYY